MKLREMHNITHTRCLLLLCCLLLCCFREGGGGMMMRLRAMRAASTLLLRSVGRVGVDGAKSRSGTTPAVAASAADWTRLASRAPVRQACTCNRTQAAALTSSGTSSAQQGLVLAGHATQQRQNQQQLQQRRRCLSTVWETSSGTKYELPAFEKIEELQNNDNITVVLTGDPIVRSPLFIDIEDIVRNIFEMKGGKMHCCQTQERGNVCVCVCVRVYVCVCVRVCVYLPLPRFLYFTPHTHTHTHTHTHNKHMHVQPFFVWVCLKMMCGCCKWMRNDGALRTLLLW